MKRILLISYSPDMKKHYKQFIDSYNEHKNELDTRNVVIEYNLNNKRSQQFEIRLYGYDGNLKYITNKIDLKKIIDLIDHMPMGKIEKKSLDLYTNAHPEKTLKGVGFKDEKTALNTIKKVETSKKSRKDKYLIIHTMYYRAKFHPHQTSNMKKAMKIFKKWLDSEKKNMKDMKNKKGGNKKLPYLPLSLVNKYEKLAEYYDISRKARGLEKPTTSDEGFLVVFRRVKGKGDKMRYIPCRKDKPTGVNWERKREIEVLGKYHQMKRMGIPLYHKEGELKGLPTKIHVNMIMWGYSPDPKGLKKRIGLLKNID